MNKVADDFFQQHPPVVIGHCVRRDDG